MIKHALAYAQRCVPVFRLAPFSNRPLAGSHSFFDATTDPEVIRAWWTAQPDANIGARTGAGFGWVLDVDPRHGGTDTLAGLEALHGPLPATPEASTPSGGRHLYFRWADGIDCCAGRIGPGLDHRGEGGYIPLPPSVRRNGAYRWDLRCPMAEAPAWLVTLARKPAPPPRMEPRPLTRDVVRYAAAAAVAELNELATAQPGTRNPRLFRAAAALAGFCKSGALPEDWTRQRLEDAALSTGLPAREVARTIDSAFRLAEPRSMPA